MKIVYLTTSMTSSTFNELVAKAKNSPNPSNQNFHHNLIRAFAANYPIQVISITPINNYILNEKYIHFADEQEEYINYHYIPFKNTKWRRVFDLNRHLNAYLKELYKKENNILLVVDGMNVTLALNAQKFAHKYNLKTLGIISDNPKLISHVSNFRKKRMMKVMHGFDSYLCLNEELNNLANPNKKPHLIISGINNHSIEQTLNSKSPFFFFGGALYEKYGIKTLIHAFENIDTKANLYIAGHGPESSYVAYKAIKNRRIHFLGVISQNNMQIYENTAIACINPRPYNENFDRFCIPSKLIEYASSKSLVISTPHTILKKVFKSSIIWCNDDEESLSKALLHALKMSHEERQKKVFKANTLVERNYGLNTISHQIMLFVNSLY